jgi:hypothetical protein
VKKRTKPQTKRQQRADEQARAVIEFVMSVEKPFVDLKPYRGESEMMKDYLTVTSIIRRLRMAEAAGMIPPTGPKRRAFKKLRAELAEESFWLLNATTHERVTRMIRTNTLP